MKVLITSSTDKISTPVLGSSFSRCAEYMNKYACMFITAFRGTDEDGNELSKTKNRERNKQLAQDIHNSDLTYIKCYGGFVETNHKTNEKQRVYEETFCVVNNGYTTDDFIKLAVSWCKKYNQDAVLITIPTKEQDSKRALNIIGKYYDKNGNIDMQFDHATLGDVEEYFTNICGKDFVLSSTEVCASDLVPFATVNGRRMASVRFAKKYPEL